MKRLSWIAAAATIAATTLAPMAAFADHDGELDAANTGALGTVETPAVTGPITAGDITYIPGPAMSSSVNGGGLVTGGATGGGQGSVAGVLGTVETPAVTGPITEGNITYVPGPAMSSSVNGGGLVTGGATGGGQGFAGNVLGSVETPAVTGPITEGNITYVPGPAMPSSIG